MDDISRKRRERENKRIKRERIVWTWIGLFIFGGLLIFSFTFEILRDKIPEVIDFFK